jgi:cyclase
MPMNRFVAGVALATWLSGQCVAAEAPVAGGTPEQQPLETRTLRDGLTLVSGAGGNVLVADDERGTVLVDSGNAVDAPRLLEAVGRVATHPVRFVVDTHWHPDHVGGNAAFAMRGAVVVSQVAARAAMAVEHRAPGYDLVIDPVPAQGLPMLTFDETLRLHLAHGRVTVLHLAAAHTGGDAVAWFEYADVVHTGDTYDAGSYPFIDVSTGGSLAGLVAALETMLSRATPDTIVVPGHGAPSGRAELAAYRDMLVAVGRRVSDLVAEGRNVDEVVAARPTRDYDAHYGAGGVSPEQFVRLLYEDLTTRR